MNVTDRMNALLSEAAPADEVWFDLPLFIRLLEFAREDANDDIDLHDVAVLAAKMTRDRKSALSMDDYEALMPKSFKKNTGGQGKSKD